MIPRCPSCGEELEISRLLRERDAGEHWVLRVACGGCLAIAGVELPKHPGKRDSLAPVLVASGAKVARTIERFRESPDREAVRRLLAGDADERLLLRVPDVAAQVRSLFGAESTLRVNAIFQEPGKTFFGRADRPQLTLRGRMRMEEATPEVLPSGIAPDDPRAHFQVGPGPLLPSGLRLKLHELDHGRVRVVLPPLEPYVRWSSLDVRAPLDLLTPG